MMVSLRDTGEGVKCPIIYLMYIDNRVLRPLCLITYIMYNFNLLFPTQQSNDRVGGGVKGTPTLYTNFSVFHTNAVNITHL